MSQIQKRLNDLKPFVSGIRFIEGLPVVDVVFKVGWIVPDSTIVHKEKSKDDPNYYMFYSENESIGFDELLDYVQEIIKINAEREIKRDLLNIKIKELQTLFKENSLERLETLKFVIGNENLAPELMDEDFTVDIGLNKTSNVQATSEQSIDQPQTESVAPHQHNMSSVTPVVDSTVVRIKKPGTGDVELPLKGKKIELEDHSLPTALTEGECSCGENEACPKCMDRKGY